MMRKLEFRAWADRKMIYGVGVVVSCVSGNQIVVKDGYDKIYTILDAIPMQFTGLLDKNGAKIFEGDKVNHMYTDRVSIVKYIEDIASFDFGVSDCVSCQEAGLDGDWMEVVGNIHEIIAE